MNRGGTALQNAGLGVFVKTSVRAKEIMGQQYRLVPPGEVLKRLNRDLIDQALSENPFITMVYMLLNFRGLSFPHVTVGTLIKAF